MSDRPVVVCGTSGYTGRLIRDYLREYDVGHRELLGVRAGPGLVREPVTNPGS